MRTVMPNAAYPLTAVGEDTGPHQKMFCPARRTWHT
jgi:hypothetical protein